MRSDTIIAYHYEGSAYCPDCGQDLEEAHPIFVDSEDEEIGATCDSCHKCLVFMGKLCSAKWLSHEEATSKDVRWAGCDKCGHKYPCFKPSADERLIALRGKFQCPSCLGELHF